MSVVVGVIGAVVAVVVVLVVWALRSVTRQLEGE